ncbi:hypothetical protein BDZ89DRAFT_1101175 [Hymenopellis radicata]|nr:hypothetical protein BDZ89DRAFT_1101175 [Hymenopellis radicata]
MSKSSTATVPKNPPQLPSKSAWSKGPPSSSRSQSPAPSSTPTHPTHSRRPSALGQGIPIKDGVGIPRNVGATTKQGPAVSFGSIDDVNAPISSSPAPTPTPPIKSEGVKSFGSVPATVSQVNGKSAVQTTAKPASSTVSGVAAKIGKVDIAKLFQGSSSASTSTPSQPSSPSVRPAVAAQPPSSQTPPGSSSPYQQFVPQNGMRQPPSAGPNGAQSGPKSPQYRHALPNGAASRMPSGPTGPPQMGSPRLSSHPPPTNMAPPPMQPPMQPWGQYYYPAPMEGQPYAAYGYSGWYMPQPGQMPPQQPPPGPHLPPHNGMPVSPRNPPMSMQGPGTPTLPHASPASHNVHPPPAMSHSTSGSISSIASPPPTPSTANGRAAYNPNANSFVPRTKISLKKADGTEVNLENFKHHSPAHSAGSLPTITSPAPASPNRRSVIRMETEEARKKRIEAEQKEDQAKLKAKQDADDKVRKEKEEKERKEREEKEKVEKAEREKKEKEEREQREKEEKEAAEKKRIEEERLEAERLKKEEEEREAERLRKEEEDKRKAEEEAEKERVRKEEEEKAKEQERLRLEAEDKEKARLAEEEATKAKAAAEAAATPKEEPTPPAASTPEPEEGEVIELAKDSKLDRKDLRIDTAAPSELPRRRPGPLDLSSAQRSNIPAPLPSALATARIINDLGSVPYPEGVKSPSVELNIGAKDNKFRYDREFLLQFMSICKEKPDMLPPLDAIGLEPSEGNFPMSRGGSGRHRQTSNASAPQRQASASGFPSGSFGKATSNPFSMGMGNFGTTTSSKLSSDERFNMSTRTASVGSASGFRPSQMQRTASQGGPGAPMGSNRVRSKRGEKRNDSNKASQHGSSGYGSAASLAQAMLEPVAPLQASANRWDRKSLAVAPDSPEIVDRKVKGLLNKLTMEKFDSISDQIIAWANKSENEKDGRTLIQVIRLVFEKATDEAAWSEMYARLCRKMMEQISNRVQDDGIKGQGGAPITGGHLFRKYLLNRCQEDFERGWVAKEATAAAAAGKAGQDEAIKAGNENKEGEEIALYSEEYYAAQKAKRQGLGLIKFIGELFKLQMLTERIMHECVKKLLGNVDNPEEEEIESLCKLLATVGEMLDTQKARAHMDVYFSRMKELRKSSNVSSRMQYMLQDVIELRERRWVNRKAVAAPATIAQIHEAAAKEKAVAEKESYQRQMTMSMSRGGSRRGADRGDQQQVGPDGWTTAGSAPRAPPKAGDLSKFGQINKGSNAPLTFGPQSNIYSGKKDNKRDSIQRTNSQNMFSMLQAETPAEPSAPKEPTQRKRLVLAPRSKPIEFPTAETEQGSDDEVDSPTEESAAPEMPAEDAKKKVGEDLKEFFAVRNLEEAEDYFKSLPASHHHLLVDKLVSSAIESKEADAQLVGDFFARASSQSLCAPAAFEQGIAPVAEFLDDIAIDAPKAPNLLAIMIKGADLSEEQRTRIASKSEESGAKLLELIS